MKKTAMQQKLFFVISFLAGYGLLMPVERNGLLMWGGVGAVLFAAIVLLLWKLDLQAFPKKNVHADGVLLCMVIDWFFYERMLHRRMRELAAVAAMVRLPLQPLLLLIVATASMLAIPFYSYCLRAIGRCIPGWKKAAKHCWEEAKFAQKPVLILFITYAAGLSALLRANFYYEDDLQRAVEGYLEFSYFGRHLSELLGRVFHAGTYAIDISPFLQLAACLLMAAASVLSIYLITGKKKLRWFHLVSVIPMGMCPFFLRCYSYKYDAVYMALSVLLSLLPLLARNQSWKKYGTLTFLSILGMCMTYQASSGFFPMMVIVLMTKDWQEGKSFRNCISWGLFSGLVYVISLIFFKTVFVDTKDLSGSYIAVEMLPMREMLPGLVRNVQDYLTYICTNSKTEWLICAGVILAGYLALYVRTSKQNKSLTLAVGLLTIALCLLLSFGIYLVLAKPLFVASYTYGIGGCIAFFALVLTGRMEADKGLVPLAAIVVLAWSVLSFALGYGNALFVQRSYTDYRVSMVAQSIAKLDSVQSGEQVYLHAEGTIGFSPVIANLTEEYNLIRDMVPVTFGEGICWSECAMCYYGNTNLLWAPELDIPEEELTVYEDNGYFTLLAKENHVLVRLK